jgi:asparagine synthase (glutamine-hydrolysing)
LGIKPFYYYHDNQRFVFASEIKALLAHPAISASLDEKALPEHLALGYVSGERTLFRGIRQLPPGHALRVKRRDGALDLEKWRYWDMPAGSSPEGIDWAAECRARLEEAVETRLMSDVPLGVFLSGGVDSSAVAALVKRLRPEALQTFSVGYAEGAFSELKTARAAATHIGSEHREIRIGLTEFFDVLPRLVWHEDEPITWPSSVPLYFVAQLAARHVKVVLTGEGADELFGGYARYRLYLWNRRWAARYECLPPALRHDVRSWCDSTALLSASLRRKIGHSFLGRSSEMESLYLDNFLGAFSARPSSSTRC